jgi:hypothetical protein
MIVTNVSDVLSARPSTVNLRHVISQKNEEPNYIAAKVRNYVPVIRYHLFQSKNVKFLELLKKIRELKGNAEFLYCVYENA